MPDASGTPTSPDNIPTFNTALDPPSGKGFNTAMAQIQTIITELKAGTLPSGKIAIAGINASGTPSATTFLRGDASWAAAGFSYGGSVASASSIAITPNSTMLLTGTTNVQTMTGGSSGNIVTLLASGQAAGIPVVIVNGTGNIRLRDGANFGLYAGECLTFVYDGTNWVEIDRNVKAVLGYTEFTGIVTANNVAEAAATQIVAAPAITFDGATPVVVEFGADSFAPGGGLTGGINLWDGATDLGRMFDAVTVTLTADTPAGPLHRRLTPTNASHTYSARVWTTTVSNFNVTGGAGGAGTKMPGYIKISRDI